MGRIILDTDIGDDIDDAFALMFVAKASKENLVGVTTTHRNTGARGQIAMALLAAAGHACPVVCGTPTSRTLPCQYIESEMACYTPDMDAAAFIARQAQAYRDLTIVTIGPLTNIAACINRYPDQMFGCRFVMMCGMVGKAFPEGNIASDPEAAQTVFEFPASKTMVSLDTTLTLVLQHAQVSAILKAKSRENALLSKMMRLFKRDYLAPILNSWGEVVNGDAYETAIGMHDPITVAYALNPSLFKTRQTHIAVETAGRYSKGLTLEQVNPFRGNVPNGYNIDLVESFDKKGVEDFFLSVLKR